jgi:tRNA G18 (ribose-2'-O)-methylase SpoU
MTEPTYIMDPALDTRNVADEFKGMSVDSIRLQMQPRRTKLVNVAMNLSSDFNKSAVLRASEAHACREFVLVNRVNEQNPENPEGIKRFDPRGAVGMKNYHPMRHTTNWKSLFDGYREEGYTIYAVDNTPGYDPQVIYNVEFPEKTVFVYGEEGLGLSDEMIQACDAMVYIPQFGVVRSLNISQAAAVCMYEYSRQWKPVL